MANFLMSFRFNFCSLYGPTTRGHFPVPRPPALSAFYFPIGGRPRDRGDLDTQCNLYRDAAF